MAAKQASTRDFTLHAAIFYQLVEKQAGTHAKATIEAIMNSIDAGSPRVDVSITRATIEIADTGKGFADDSEVKRFFSTLGTPHEEGDRTYGVFRIGRAQCFRFGTNVWRSNEFQMVVDVRGRGREHEVTRGLPHHQGCSVSIELYDPLAAREAEALAQTVSEWVAWAPVPVWVNGKLASRSPESRTDWTIDDEDAWVSLDESTELSVFNRGIFVCALDASRLGTGGTIVSKKQLDLLYAHNAVQERCPAWKSIQRKVKALTLESAARRSLGPAQRAYMCGQLLSGELSLAEADHRELRLFTTIDGSHHPLSKFVAMAEEGLACAAAGDALAERLHRNRITHVLDSATVDRFGALSLAALVERLSELHRDEAGTLAVRHARNGFQSWQGPESHLISRLRERGEALAQFQEAKVEDYRGLVSAEMIPIPPSRQPPGIRAYASALQAGLRHAGHGASVAAAYSERVTVSGASGTILVNPLLMPDLSEGIGAAMRTAALLVHFMAKPSGEDEADAVAVARALASHDGMACIAEGIIDAIGKQAAHGAPRALSARNDADAFASEGRRQAALSRNAEPAVEEGEGRGC